jgi:hypothetical protein
MTDVFSTKFAHDIFLQKYSAIIIHVNGLELNFTNKDKMELDSLR